jgi:rhomboid protease GluP
MDEIRNQLSTASHGGISKFFSILIPRTGFYVTPILLIINILVFVLMLLNGAGFIKPDIDILVEWGGNFKPLTVYSGQWWRLLTSTFIHAGVFHLLMNMYALLYIGLLLEPYLGKTKFTVFYILSGLAASATSIFWHEQTVSVGASGAIFGLYGIFLAMLTTSLIEKTARSAFLTSVLVFVVYSLLNGMKGNIDNAAHIGGLLSGICLGYGAYFSLKFIDNKKLQITTVSISIAIVITTIYLVLGQKPRYFEAYDNKMKEFAQFESEALQLYIKPGNDTKIALSQIIIGLNNWQKCIAIFDSIDNLDLPLELRIRTDKLREYVNLRIETYNMLQEGILKDSINEQLLIAKYNKIDSLLKKMQNR